MNTTIDLIEKTKLSSIGYAISNNEYIHFEQFETNRDLDTFMYGVILEHISDEFDITPNEKLIKILNYIKEKGRKVYVYKLEIDNDNEVFEYNNYYFQFVWSENNTLIRITNKPDMRLILEIWEK